MKLRAFISTLFALAVGACGDDGGVVPPECGNGILDGAEVCDDGNTSSGDGCSASCNSMEACGNGILDVGESCDDGNTVEGDGCSPSCKSAFCGNGALDGVEVCDDGNTTNGDGCNASCSSVEVCGNGVVDTGESCDDGNTDDGDGCSSECVSEFCGNTELDPGEVCDDGNHTPGDGCNATCSSDETCGNGVLDPDESCDDGDTTGGDGCSATCVSEVCGNGVVENGEVCDDGDNEPGDGCNATCSSDETCGNGVLDPGEECEDDNDVDGDGCSTSCELDGGRAYLFTVEGNNDILQRYDLELGVLENVGPLGVSFMFGDLAYDANDEVLFMIDGRGAKALYTVNIATGAATLVGAHGITDLFGLVWDPRTDTLYASVRDNNKGFYRIDQATGAATFIGTIAGATNGYDGMTFDTRRQRLVGVNAGTGDLFTIDPATGAGASLASTGFINNCGLAYEPTGDRYWSFDWSGNVYSWDPNASMARTSVLTGLTSHDATVYIRAAP